MTTRANRRGRGPLTTCGVLGIVALAAHAFVLGTSTPVSAEDGPIIDIWEGLDQQFGETGVPQVAVNVHGNVSDPDGVASLTYTVNDDPEIHTLRIGPDGRRLARAGDFTIELPVATLNDGNNVVHLTATDDNGAVSNEDVNVGFTAGNTWALPYDTDWSTATSVGDDGQIVDGRWALDGDGIRTIEAGYDRLIAIGDMAWTDYEVTVPVTINDIDEAGFTSGPGGTGAGLGLIMRWNGHTDEPIQEVDVPKTGWRPLGAIGWWWWDEIDSAWLEIQRSNGGRMAGPIVDTPPAEGSTLWYKMRVETDLDGTGHYSLKVWDDGGPEPADWSLEGNSPAGDPTAGSFLLVAHYVDATFGNVQVRPILPAISDVTVDQDSESAVVSWSTDEPTTGAVAFGPTSAYENGEVTSDVLTTDHSVTLTGLSPVSTYHYRITAVDQDGNDSSTPDATFETTPMPSPAGFVSDDFNVCAVDPLWSFVDPVGDGSASVNGTELELSVPAGVTHDVWTGGNMAPRVMQAVNDVDFELVAKFDSVVADQYEMQGFIVEQDENNFLRLDVHGTDSGQRLFAARFVDGSPPAVTNIGVSLDGPVWLRVGRTEDQWSFDYSVDGELWQTGASFSHALSVSQAGLFVGNAGSSPAHTAVVDYVFDTAAPIPDEDADTVSCDPTLDVTVVGDGTVAVSPDQPAYELGDVVTLTATPNEGSEFVGWSSHVTSTASPLDVTIDQAIALTATFEKLEYSVSTSTSGSGSVVVDPAGGTYTHGTDVKVTASQDAGWEFTGWTGDLTGTSNPTSLTIDGNKSVTATFERTPAPPPPPPTSTPPPPPPPNADGVFDGMIPTRLLDTRVTHNGDAQGHGYGIQGHNDVIRVNIGPDPAALNLTAVQPTGPGHFVMYPCAGGAGSTSSLNWTTADRAVPNMVVATPDRNGDVCIKTALPAGGAVHVVVDRTGTLYSEGGFFGQAPKRLRDSRNENSKLAAGATMKVTGLTPDAGAILNLTVAQPESAGHLTAYPCAEGRPTSSVANYRAGQAKANMTIVSADHNGHVCLYTLASSHLIVDHLGTIATTNAEFMSPHRLLDSRVEGGKQTTYRVAIPNATGRAAILSVTAARSTGPGHATVYPCGGSVPTASTVNFAAGQPVSNHVAIAPNAKGQVCITTVGSPHIVVDLAGYLGQRG